jgi:hypothetical protein
MTCLVVQLRLCFLANPGLPHSAQQVSHGLLRAVGTATGWQQTDAWLLMSAEASVPPGCQYTLARALSIYLEVRPCCLLSARAGWLTARRSVAGEPISKLDVEWLVRAFKVGLPTEDDRQLRPTTAFIWLYWHTVHEVLDTIAALLPALAASADCGITRLAEGMRQKLAWLKLDLTVEHVARAVELHWRVCMGTESTTDAPALCREIMEEQMDDMRSVVLELRAWSDARAADSRSCVYAEMGESGGSEGLREALSRRLSEQCDGFERWVTGGFVTLVAHGAGQRSQSYIYGSWSLWPGAVQSCWRPSMIVADVAPAPQDLRCLSRGLAAAAVVGRTPGGATVQVALFRTGMLRVLVDLHSKLGDGGSGGGMAFGGLVKQLHAMAVRVAETETDESGKDAVLALLLRNPQAATTLLDEASDLSAEVGKSGSMESHDVPEGCTVDMGIFPTGNDWSAMSPTVPEQQHATAEAVQWLLTELDLALLPHHLDCKLQPLERPIDEVRAQNLQTYGRAVPFVCMEYLPSEALASRTTPAAKRAMAIDWAAIPDLCARRGLTHERHGSEPGVLALQAAAEGDLTMLRVLLDCGVPPDTHDSNFESILMLACARNQLQCVRYILAAGAAVNATTRDGSSALQLASVFRCTHSVAALLQHRADNLTERCKIENTDNNGHSARDLAVSLSANHIIDLLDAEIERRVQQDVPAEVSARESIHDAPSSSQARNVSAKPSSPPPRSNTPPILTAATVAEQPPESTTTAAAQALLPTPMRHTEHRSTSPPNLSEAAVTRISTSIEEHRRRISEISSQARAMARSSSALTVDSLMQEISTFTQARTQPMDKVQPRWIEPNFPAATTPVLPTEGMLHGAATTPSAWGSMQQPPLTSSVRASPPLRRRVYGDASWGFEPISSSHARIQRAMLLRALSKRGADRPPSPIRSSCRPTADRAQGTPPPQASPPSILIAQGRAGAEFRSWAGLAQSPRSHDLTSGRMGWSRGSEAPEGLLSLSSIE